MHLLMRSPWWSSRRRSSVGLIAEGPLGEPHVPGRVLVAALGFGVVGPVARGLPRQPAGGGAVDAGEGECDGGNGPADDQEHGHESVSFTIGTVECRGERV